MRENLRSGYGDVQEVRVTFAQSDRSGSKGVMRRLIEVASALDANSKVYGPARYVTKISTDFNGGCVVVDACVTTSTTAEELQRLLLDLVPSAAPCEAKPEQPVNPGYIGASVGTEGGPLRHVSGGGNG